MNFLDRIFKSRTINVTGFWTGHYTFGDQYSEIVRSEKVNFITQIIGDKGGSFTGTIKESGGIDEISKIEGRVIRKKISFTKTYAQSYSIDSEGTIKTTTHGPQYIIYEGIYDESTQTFCGEWRIEAMYTFQDGSRVEHISSGHWELQRS